MSHKVTISTTIQDKGILCKALDRMQVAYTEGSFKIAGQQCELSVNNKVGFHQAKDGTYQLVGDPYYCPSLRKYYNKNQKLMGDLQTAYAIEETEEVLGMQQFMCVENQEAAIGEDGMIRLTYQQM